MPMVEILAVDERRDSIARPTRRIGHPKLKSSWIFHPNPMLYLKKPS
jgi:hypothetical protein